MAQFVGKTVIVTGGSGGIGSAIVGQFAERGAQVVNLDRTAPATCETGPAARFVPVDLRSRDSIVAAFDQIRALGRPIDILVNSAGVAVEAGFLDLTEADWDLQFEVNFFSACLTMQLAAEDMIGRGSGRIVNIASISASTPSRLPESAYDASKAALLRMTRSVARELAIWGVTVNCVSPGTIDTPLNSANFRDVAGRAAVARSIPAQRLGTPADVAEAVVFLCSEPAGWICGCNLVIDGGITT